MTSQQFGQHKSYEFYSHVGKYIAKHGMDGAAKDFANADAVRNARAGAREAGFMKETIDQHGRVMGNFSLRRDALR